MEVGAPKQERQNKKVVRRLLGQNLRLVSESTTNYQRLQSKQEKSTEEEEMKQQHRMKVMKDLTKENQVKRKKLDAESRWWGF